MAAWQWLSSFWNWLVTMFYASIGKKTASRLSLLDTTLHTSRAQTWERLRTEIDSVGVYDLHNILRLQNRLDWSEWHLTIGDNDNAIKTVEKFHQEIEKSILSSSVISKINTIEETFLNFMPTDNDWNDIRASFQQARQENSPLPIVKAYTLTQKLSERINKHSAANTYHALKLYCTLLNCPVLAQTQEYTEAITSLLFHPKLDEFVIRSKTVYRGTILKNNKPIVNYKEGATIIITTFLSTSSNPAVANAFAEASYEGMLSLFCTYNINNTHRRTALDLTKITNFQDEEEILILRYAPFTIKSLERSDDGRRVTICFDECKE